MQLIETPDNPIPAGAKIVTVETRDDLVLRAASWLPQGDRVRGTICIFQGRAEFIEKYFETVQNLLDRGFAVLAFDWRGQGLSRRQIRNPRKGHVRSFRYYRRDYEAVRERILDNMPRPHFVLAHSMGGAIALTAAQEGWLGAERLVAVAPMLGLCNLRRPQLTARVALVLNWLGFGQRYVPGGNATSIARKPFPGNRLTSDPRRYARNAAVATELGPGAIGDPTVGWVSAAFRAMQRLAEPEAPRAIRLPILIVAAGADLICATPIVERFAARLKAGHAIVIPGARHEILMERDSLRNEFWAAFDAFIPGTGTAPASSPIQKLERSPV